MGMLGLNVDAIVAGFKKDLAGLQTQLGGMADDLTAIRKLLEIVVEQGRSGDG